MTTERLFALHAALDNALSALGFASGTREEPNEAAGSAPEGLAAWSCVWATVLVLPTSAAEVLDSSLAAELWVREAFGLPLRNRPRRDWYLLLAVDEPVAGSVEREVESTDRVLRRHVVHLADGAWDLGRLALLPLGNIAAEGTALEYGALPAAAEEALRWFRENKESTVKISELIDTASRKEAHLAR